MLVFSLDPEVGADSRCQMGHKYVNKENFLEWW
jgi:hypothetical protein